MSESDYEIRIPLTRNTGQDWLDGWTEAEVLEAISKSVTGHITAGVSNSYPEYTFGTAEITEKEENNGRHVIQ